LKGRISTVDLLVRSAALHTEAIFFLFFKTYLNEEVNSTEPFLSVRVLCILVSILNIAHDYFQLSLHSPYACFFMYALKLSDTHGASIEKNSLP
jgi:hypothetical protein